MRSELAIRRERPTLSATDAISLSAIKGRYAVLCQVGSTPGYRFVGKSLQMEFHRAVNEVTTA